MAAVKDAREAEDMVDEYYRERFPFGPWPNDFETYKRGYTWIVNYNLQTVMDIEEHEVHINARTGNMVMIK